MPLGVLQDMHGLQEAAASTVQHHQQTYVTSLQQVLTTLHDAVAGMEEARGMLACKDDNDTQLWCTQPVFVSYTMKQLGMWSFWLTITSCAYSRSISDPQNPCGSCPSSHPMPKT